MDIKIDYEWHGLARKVKTGKIAIYTKDRKKRLGYITFAVEETQISVDDLHVSKSYRRRGFGRLLMMMVMALAEEVKKPIFLFSTDEGISFYETLGMRRIVDYKKWDDVKVKFMNLNSKKKFIEQCSDEDFVWVPSGMRRIKIYL